MIEHVKKTSLPEICALVTDGTHDSPKLQRSGVPFIKGKHISSGSIDFENCDYITEEDHLKCIKRVKPQINDVLFANIGSIGDVARVIDEREFSIKNVALFRPNPHKVDPTYFYYLVASPSFREVFLNTRSGAAQPFISLEAFRSHRFSFNSDKTSQQRIGEVLSAYDDQIVNNNRRIRLLEESARLLYQEWFVRLRFPGYEHTKIDNGLPDGWEKTLLGDKVILNYGRALKADDRTDGSFPVYGSSGIVGTHEKALTQGPGIVVGRKGNVGSIYWSSKDYYPIDTVYFIDSETSNLYLYYALKYMHFISTDVAVPGLNRDFAYSRPLLLPTKRLLRSFLDFVVPVHEQIDKLDEMKQKLKSACDLLLPRLMSGEIAV